MVKAHRLIRLGLLGLILGLVLFPTVSGAAPAPPFYHANGYLVTGPFLEFYRAQGGAAVFGEPRTDAFVEAGGLTVQYFAYARFEWHNRVALTHLGRQAATGHPNQDAFAWRGPDALPPADGLAYVPESGHFLGGAFRWYWQHHGQVALLGYPISEEFTEARPDGTTGLTQYFERAVLTYHPEAAGTADEVRRVPLGAQIAPERPQTAAPTVRATASLPLPQSSGDAANIAVALARLDGLTLAPGKRLSFLAATGPYTRKAGYVPGSAIENGEIVSDSIGGGVCVVSTLFYRAAWQAGLAVESRNGHRYWLATYTDQPGLEAAVSDPELDLVVRNDTPAPVFIEAVVEAGTATLRLWTAGDGRTVALAHPEVRTGQPSAGGAGASTPASNPQRDGATVVNVRTVRVPGKKARAERVVTVYAPLPAPEEEAEEDVTPEPLNGPR